MTRRRLTSSIPVCLIALAMPAIPCVAADAPVGWPTDAQTGVEVCRTAGSQDDPCVVRDATGGVFVAWRASGGRGGDDVFAQRLDSAGVARWGAAGVPVCLAAADQRSPVMVADGSGGVIVVWEDHRGSLDWDLYAQRLDRDGHAMWTDDGAPVSLARGDQLAPRLRADGHGGVWVVWEDRRGGDVDLYAQALDPSGSARWSPDGVALVTQPGAQTSADVVNDRAGGAIVVWRDERRGAGRSDVAEDVYGQRLAVDGVPRWASGGVPLAGGVSAGAHPKSITDGAGGMVMVWEAAAVMAQRVDSSGARVWGPDGVTLSDGPGSLPALARSGDGVMVVWQSGLASGGNAVLRACRVTGAGVVRDAAGGLTVSWTRGAKTDLVAIPDGEGGMIAGWRDSRDEGFATLLAQRADSSGTPRWSARGAVISAAPGFQRSLRLCSDGAGGVIAVWVDARHGQHLYAQRLDADGRRGGVATPVESPGHPAEPTSR